MQKLMLGTAPKVMDGFLLHVYSYSYVVREKYGAKCHSFLLCYIRAP